MASSLPYIVSSRINKDLISRLNEDQDPMLVEGIHCTGILPYLAKDRSLVLRLHNNEAAYYRQLAHSEINPVRNLYYTTEANRLDRYQQKLSHQLKVAAISAAEQEYFTNRMGWNGVQWVPAFTPWQQAQFRSYAEPYCLYHGDLSVAANATTAKWLANNVFEDGAAHLVVAGRNPPKGLVSEMEADHNCTIIANPTEAYLEQLIGKAQVNLVPALHPSGVKLKLLHALFRGRHVVANAAAVSGSGLQEAVHLAEDVAAFKQQIGALMQQPFGPREIKERAQWLAQYDTAVNAQKLATMLF